MRNEGDELFAPNQQNISAYLFPIKINISGHVQLSRVGRITIVVSSLDLNLTNINQKGT